MRHVGSRRSLLFRPSASSINGLLAAYFSAIAAQGTPASDSEKAAVTKFITTISSLGIYDLLDRLWLVSQASEAAASIDFITLNIFLNNSCVWNEKGFQGDGAGAYISSGYVPGYPASNNYTVNSGSIGGYYANITTGSKFMIFGTDDFSDGKELIYQDPSENYEWQINDRSFSQAFALGAQPGNGVYAVNRDASTRASLFMVSNTSLDTFATVQSVSTTPSFAELFFLANNSGGAAENPTDGSWKGGWAGAGLDPTSQMSQFIDAWDVYQNDLPARF